MLRKLLWTGLLAGFTAAAALAAKKSAAQVWRVLTGEEPPARK
jgi:hypothetical protein